LVLEELYLVGCYALQKMLRKKLPPASKLMNNKCNEQAEPSAWIILQP
jgi:hypothetical protein